MAGQPNAQYNVAAPGSLPVRIAAHQRRKMFARFMQDTEVAATERILDVGVTSDRSYEASNYLEALVSAHEQGHDRRDGRRVGLGAVLGDSSLAIFFGAALRDLKTRFGDRGDALCMLDSRPTKLQALGLAGQTRIIVQAPSEVLQDSRRHSRDLLRRDQVLGCSVYLTPPSERNRPLS